MFILLLFTGCSTSPITGMFEMINASDPLPANFAEKAEENYSNRPPPSTKNSYSNGLSNYSNPNTNENRGNESSFEEWHNNQY